MLKRFFSRGATAIDPVCRMRVDKGDPPGGIYKHSGIAYYFCGDGCRRAFEKDPSAYLHETHSDDAALPKDLEESDGILDPTAPISFTAVDDPSGEGKFVDVEYQCVCGCRPGARVVAGSSVAGSEHCCCGRVHFAGSEAESQIRSYMSGRAETNMDDDVGPYVYDRTEASTKLGVKIPISYAQPIHPRK